jgi:hypothetical protein
VLLAGPPASSPPPGGGQARRRCSQLRPDGPLQIRCPCEKTPARHAQPQGLSAARCPSRILSSVHADACPEALLAPLPACVLTAVAASQSMTSNRSVSNCASRPHQRQCPLAVMPQSANCPPARLAGPSVRGKPSPSPDFPHRRWVPLGLSNAGVINRVQ